MEMKQKLYVIKTTSGHEYFVDRNIAEKEVTNLINNGKTAQMYVSEEISPVFIEETYIAASRAGFNKPDNRSGKHSAAFRTVYALTDDLGNPQINSEGETMSVEVSIGELCDAKDALPRLWHKHGYINRVLENWWSITTYVKSSDGATYGYYNPQVIHDGKRPIIDFDWMFEATPENLTTILNECANRFINLKRN